MKPLRCIITDDEPLARDLLAGYIEQIPELSLVARCEDALEAFSILKQASIDLLFLDIQMPGINGLDFLRTLKQHPHVILTTAYQEYAHESYDLDVVDYLLKPIAFDRFLRAVNRVIGREESQSGIQHKRAEVIQRDYIFIKVEHKLVKVAFEEIQYMESLKDYIRIICDERKLLTLSSMKDMFEQLPADKFQRIHRSYIIPLDRIEAIEGNAFHIGGQMLPVGKSYRKEIFDLLNEKGIL